jgi:predicted RNA-binding Zn-ribbon protein involved in translation (DUF1610 family)
MMRRGTLESLLNKPALLTDRFLEMTRLFRPGDVVESALTPGTNYGVVKEVDEKARKVIVIWNSGHRDQVDQDEIQIVPNVRPEIEQRIKNEMLDLQGRRMAGKADGIIPPGFIEDADPETHGVTDPRGGGFSIMQQLQQDLHKESLESAKTGKVNGCIPRRAVYHKQRGRVYQRSQAEVQADTLKCPRCGEEGMEKEPFTKGVHMYRCPGCGWKITTDKLL